MDKDEFRQALHLGKIAQVGFVVQSNKQVLQQEFAGRSR